MVERTDVAIIGGGIGGLALALAMQIRGMDFRIYERVPTLRGVGAGIQVAPNATRLLFRWGLEEGLRSTGVTPREQIFHRWQDDALLAATSLDEVAAAFGAPHLTIHRADLHDVIRSAIDPDRIVLDRQATRIDMETGPVCIGFSEGHDVEARVVIGSDGIHSTMRATLADDAPRYSGQSVFRSIIPAERLPDARYLDGVHLWLGPDQHCGCYPISSRRSVSLAATVPLQRAAGESWTQAGSKKDLLAAYAGWNPGLMALLDAADSVSVWGLYDREPLGSIHRGSLALLGDAAHPMLPFLSQGANQAVEDAAVLAVCFERIGINETALAAYDRIRSTRAVRIQEISLGNNARFHLPDGPDQRLRDAALAEAGMSGLATSLQEWLYGYDGEEDAVRSS